MRIAEKDDITLLVEWFNDVRFAGDYQHFPVQITGDQLERRMAEHRLYEHEWVDFLVEKKDGAKIGWAAHCVSAPNFGWVEIGYSIIPTREPKAMELKLYRSLQITCSSQKVKLQGYKQL